MEERIRNTFNRDLRSDNKNTIMNSNRQRHYNWIEEKITETRMKNLSIEDTCMNSEQEINIDNLNNSLIYLNSKNYSDKSLLRNYLKTFRREISKSNFKKNILSHILQGGTFINILSEFIFDYKNSEIQLESLWIINNICIYCYEYEIVDAFFNIHYYLTDFMKSSEKCFSNSGVKNLIMEKFFYLIGNLILYDQNIITHYLTNNIIYYLVTNLNSSVRSFRSTCLWTINNFISFDKSIIDKYIMKYDIMYYIRNLFGRIDISKSFSECFEFLYLLYYISCEGSSYLILFQDINNNKNIKILLNLLFIERMHQPILRILGNILADDTVSGNSITQYILNSNDVIIFLGKCITDCTFSYLLVDIFWFIKNLLYYDNKIGKYFITNMNELLNNIEYNGKSELFTNIFLIIFHYYWNNNEFISTNLYLTQFIKNNYISIADTIQLREIILNISVNILIFKGKDEIANKIMISTSNKLMSKVEYINIMNELVLFI